MMDRPIHQATVDDLPVTGDGSGLRSDDLFHREEVQLAIRNRGIPLEAMRYPITPTGLHYLIIHFDLSRRAAGRLEPVDRGVGH